MTGGSLSIRTGSYGSLHNHYQQQQQLYGGPNGAAASPAIQPSPPLSAGRKPLKMLLPGGAREKERFLPWICRLAGRRKVGMLLILAASVAFFLTFISLINKDDDSSANPETTMSFSDQVLNPVNHVVSSSNPSPFVSSDNGNQPLVSVLRPSITLEHHPCENFSLPSLSQQEPKRTGPRPCPVCYVPEDLAIALMPASPSVPPVLEHLSYVSEENLVANESSEGSVFGGYPSLEQRAESFDIKESMTVHCGFVRGKKPGQGTGFDIDDADLLEMEQCRGVVVASAIFGNYDLMQQPRNISEAAKKNACFYMFLDEETEAYIQNTSAIDSNDRVGLWRVVVVRNLPYADSRRNGKVPKLLLHRLFPNARFSLWIDGKLELVVDPYQVLERFLWRQNATFAISRHYRRFDVFVEAEANKAAGKYENASIDYQIEFYKREGLTPYSPAKLPITSDVPEGCVIIREHTPITNLFTCLWFNEVDRFTSRDQLSFSTVRDKIMSKVNWTVNMFLDCERRNFVVQAYHRDLLEQRKSLAASRLPLPSLKNESHGKQVADLGQGRTTKYPPSRRRGKDRKSSSRRRHPRVSGGRELF